MKLPELRPRQPLFGVALFATVGIALADRFTLPLWPALAVTAVLVLVTVLRPRAWSCWLLVGTAFATLHTLRHRHSDAAEFAEELTAGPRVVRTIGVVWSQPEAPKFWSRNVTAQFRLRIEQVVTNGQTRHPNACVNVTWAGAMPAYGDRVSFTASARNIEPSRNPGPFDFSAYLRRQGIFSEMITGYASDCHILDHGHGSRAQVFAYAAQGWIRDRLQRDLEDSPEVSALIASMVLGLRGETSDEMKEMFQRTGTLHLFAVSGLNVAMLATIAWMILKPLRMGRKGAVMLIVPLLCAYALVTGLSASCVRATIMGSLVFLAVVADRRAIVYNSLAAAALCILAWDTNQLFTPGFQFSFLLVFTIVLLAGRIQRKVEPLGSPDAFLPKPLWNLRQRLVTQGWGLFSAALGVTLAAWVGSLFFTANYFHLFSPAAIFANLLAVPLAFLVLALAVGALIAALGSTTGLVWFNNANWLVTKGLIWVVKMFALLPGGHLYVEAPGLARAPDCELTVFDLHGGGATHLRAGPHDWMLDCGHDTSYPGTILPYLRSRGVDSLDGLLLTHGDANHIGAAIPLTKDFSPAAIVDGVLKDRSGTRREIVEELAALRLGRRICGRGDVLSIAPRIDLRVLFPPRGLTRNVADDKALVLRLECAGRRILLMSDSGFATEQWLIQNETDLSADVIVKGQHAKDFSGTAEFLARVNPAAIVCSGGSYGELPTSLDDWETAASARGAQIFRQDRCGAAIIELRDGAITIRGFANGQTFNSRAR